MASFIDSPELFEERFQYELRYRPVGARARIETSFEDLIQTLEHDDCQRAVLTIVAWLKDTANHQVVTTLMLMQNVNCPQWNWENTSLGAQLLVHSNDVDLITLATDWSVFDQPETARELLEANRLDLFAEVVARRNLDWLHNDVANPVVLHDFFTYARDVGQWNEVYQILRPHFSFRWTATALHGDMVQVCTVLNDPEFQAWSKTFDYFAGLYHEQINTYNAYKHLKNHNLFDAFRVDPHLLAVRSFATVLWDSHGSRAPGRYALAEELVNDRAPGRERVQFLEMFGILVEQRIFGVSEPMDLSSSMGANSLVSPDQIFDDYFTAHFADFFEQCTWDTSTAQHILQSFSWFLNLSAFRQTAPVQAALLKLNLEHAVEQDRAIKQRKI